MTDILAHDETRRREVARALREGVEYTFDDAPLWILQLTLAYAGSHLQYPVPTEVVVTKACVVAPRTRRTYQTGLYSYHPVKELRKILTYEEVCKLDGFKGTSMTPALAAIFLEEVWEDCGEDGHINYQHVGYRFTLKGV